MLNKVKRNSFAPILWMIFACTVHIVLFKTKVNFDYSIGQRILTAIIAIGFTLTVHELIHFIFMKIFYKGTVKIEFARDPLGVPALRTVAQGEAKKWQKVITFLAPFVVLTILLDIVFVFCNKIELLFFIISVCNSAGCWFDIVAALSLKRN